ncbi:MAG: SPASM domain-containing protein, partial [bacterium]
VLTSHLARRPSDYYQFIKKHHFDHIQIIPCLTLFHGTSPDACTPHDFASFYRQIFYLWKKDLRKGYYVSINLFEELLRLLSGQKAAQCGMMGFCGIQYVIEANGDVYPCDFYCLDAWRIGNVCEDDLQSLTNHPLRRTFLGDQPLLSPLCQSCHYRKFCQGNCKRQSSALYDQHFCGLQKIYQLFDSQYEEILTLVKGTL